MTKSSNPDVPYLPGQYNMYSIVFLPEDNPTEPVHILLTALENMLLEHRSTMIENKLDYCIFGHIGNGHVHVNILPKKY
jgi:hypothetical protein